MNTNTQIASLFAGSRLFGRCLISVVPAVVLAGNLLSAGCAASDDMTTVDEAPLELASLESALTEGIPDRREIASPGDRYVHTFTLSSSSSCTFKTKLLTLQDSILTLYGPDSATTFIAENDDSDGGLASKITAQLGAGVYYPTVRGYGSATGEYELSVECGGDRNYGCGFAMAGVSGNICENGRTSRYVVAPDMTTAISACQAVQPADRPYFCAVLDLDGTAPNDEAQCLAAPALGPLGRAPAWRPGRSCCRFEGETTCPN